MQPTTIFAFIRWFLPVFFCLVLITSNAQDNNASAVDSSIWLDKKIIIDGKATEWNESDFVNDEKSGFRYLISNDSSVLYICIIAGDDIITTKILNAGFSIFLNNEGKKKKSYVIDYPLKDEENNVVNNPEKLQDLKSLKVISFLHARNYQLSGFKKGDGLYSIDDANNAGIKVSVGLADYSGDVVYETTIPFSSIFKAQPSFQTNNEANIAVCFSINALPKPGSNSASETVGITGGRSTSRQVGRIPINNPATIPGDFSQRNKLFESSKTWKIIALAKHS